MKTELITVTPKLAEKLLLQNSTNRPMYRSNLRKLKADISSGNWKVNGATIKVSKSGKLLDGQHRLQAVIETGESIQTLIVRDVVDDCFPTIDINKNRTAGDSLSVAGYSKNVGFKASAIKQIMHFQQGGSTAMLQALSYTNQEVLDFMDEELNEQLGRAALFAGARTLIGSRNMGSFYVLFEGDKKDEFFELLDTGIGLKPGSPIAALRNKIIKTRLSGDRMLMRTVAAYVVASWIAFRGNRKLAFLKPRHDYSYTDFN